MKKIYIPLLSSLAIAGAATAVPAEAPREGHTAQRVARPDGRILRGPKLGDSKYDNSDGHDLREITVTGDYRMPVILVQFADASFTQGKDDPRALIDRMLNDASFDYQNATGSANAFYRAVSGGQFNPTFDVYGPVTLSRPERDYVATNPDDTYTDPATGEKVTVYPAGRMVEEAIKMLDSEIDFSKYDADADGNVDFVYLFFAGKGATTGGSTTSTVWPHAFTLASAIGAPVELDGVKVNRYATSSELGADNRLSGIGTFCHEFAHVLGLPDLYDTSNNNGQASKCFTPGPFDCMDAGNYNNSEHTPAIFSAYEQYALEWMAPVEITGGGHLTLLPLEAHPFAYKVSRYDTPTEYYILENRGTGYYDRFLPASGLLAWHIDFNATAWEENRPNNDATHMRIDLIEADNEKSESSRVGDPFPGSGGVCEFTANVTPAFKDWAGNGMGYELYGIRRNFDGTVEFDAVCMPDVVMPGRFDECPAPELLEAAPDALTVVWPRLEEADGYYVSVFPREAMTAADGDTLPYEAYIPGWHYRNVGTPEDELGMMRVKIEGLLPNTDYCVMVYGVNASQAVRMERPLNLRTVDGSDFASLIPNLSVSAGADGKVLAIWDEIPEADGVALKIFTRSHGADGEKLTVDFTDKTLPEGWQGGGEYDSRAKYYGESAPSYRLTADGAALCTPVFPEEVKSISFWCRKRYTDTEEACRLDVYTADALGRWSYDRTLSDFTRDGERRMVEFAPGVHGVRLEYRYWSTELDFNIDDIEVLTGGTSQMADAAEAVIDADGTQALVSGLDADKEYRACVEYTKAGATARSAEVSFRPGALAPSGVDDIEMAAAVSFRVAERGEVVASDSGIRFAVYAADGRCIDAAACGSCRLPSRGVYVIRVAGQAAPVKVIW